MKAAEELQLAEERQRIKAEKAAAKARKVAEQKDRGTGMGRWEEEDGAGRVFSNSDIFHGMVFYKRKIHCPRRYEMEVLILKRTRKDCPAKFVSLGWGGDGPGVGSAGMWDWISVTQNAWMKTQSLTKTNGRWIPGSKNLDVG